MLERLKIRLPEIADDGTQDELLQGLLDDAEDTVLDLIGRDELPKRLESVVVALAVIAWERLGTEGSASRSEGGLSLSFIDGLPADLKARLVSYPRKVRVIGDASEAE